MTRPDTETSKGLQVWLPRVALLTLAGLWLGLVPWRPLLAGDDFGYYDSVVRSLGEGRWVTSDWLNPFSVGLTLPAAQMVNWTGDLWLGCVLTVGLFGALGLWAWGHLLRRSGATAGESAWAVTLWALFPAWLTKWTHFESAVPATSLMLLAVVCYLAAQRSGAPRLALLLGGGLALAWAVSIRQNHLVLALAGAAGCWLADGRRRVWGSALWALPAFVAFFWLQYGLPKTFAQEHMVAWQISQLDAGSYLGRFARGGFFSLGAAALLFAASCPGRAWAWWRRAKAGNVWLGAGTLLVLLGVVSQQGSAARWLAPSSDFLLFERVPWLLGAVTCVGSFVAAAWVSALWDSRQPTALILSAGAVGYVALASLWGYWEYYFLEVILLLWLAGMQVPLAPEGRGSVTGSPGGVLRLAGLAAYACAAWYGQRVLIDFQAAQTRVVEECFRAAVVRPAECSGVPFGLLGWNLFPGHVQRWRAAPQGGPLDFSRGRDIRAHFRWRGDAEQEGAEILRSGQMRVGFVLREWRLLVSVSRSAMPPAAGEHRLLPLTSTEWREHLSRMKGRTP